MKPQEVNHNKQGQLKTALYWHLLWLNVTLVCVYCLFAYSTPQLKHAATLCNICLQCKFYIVNFTLHLLPWCEKSNSDVNNWSVWWEQRTGARHNLVQLNSKQVIKCKHQVRELSEHERRSCCSRALDRRARVTHVPRSSFKWKIFLMSSICFFHVSPPPVSPFSRAMSLLHRPQSGRPSGLGEWRDTGK